MLTLVNGMDVVKLPNLMDGEEYKGHMKNKCISLEVLLMALLIHYTPELGNHCRLLTCYTMSKSQHPFHYQELSSISVREIHIIHSITKSWHLLVLGELTAPMLLTRASIQ